MINIDNNCYYSRVMPVFGCLFNYPYCYLSNLTTGDTLTVKTSDVEYKSLWDKLYSKFSLIAFNDKNIYMENTSMGEKQCIDLNKCEIYDANEIISNLLDKVENPK